MAELWKNNKSYVFCRLYVDFVTWMSFRKVEVVGRENVPKEGAVLLAPNHCNTLMDALAVLLTRRSGIVFGCRADLFRNPKVAKMLNWLKIIPVPRERDGVEAMKSGKSAVETASDVLMHGMPFCLYSEGTHRAKHSLLPIKKGIFRMAFDVMSKSDIPVYVVPVGLEYGDYFRFRNTVLVNIGEPIDVGAFVASKPDASEAELYRMLSELLRVRLAERITYLCDDENYDGHWALVKFLASGPYMTLSERLGRNRALVSCIERASDINPEEVHELRYRALQLDEARKKCNISVRSFGFRTPLWRTLGKILVWLIGLPYFIFAAIASLPLWLGAEIKCHSIKDRPFINSLRTGFAAGGIPILTLIWGVVLFCLLDWWIALLALIATIPSYFFFYGYSGFTRVLFSDIRLLFHPELNRMLDRILKDFSTLAM